MHDRVVVPAEDGRATGPTRFIHERVVRTFHSLGHRSLSPFEEAPATVPRAHRGIGLDQVRQLDPGDPGLETHGMGMTLRHSWR